MMFLFHVFVLLIVNKQFTLTLKYVICRSMYTHLRRVVHPYGLESRDRFWFVQI